MQYTDQEVALCAQMIDYYAARRWEGDYRAYPYSILKSLRAATVQCAVEAIIVDDELSGYMLARRPAGETKYGDRKLYVLGGFICPGDKNMLIAAENMAHLKHGIEGLSYLAGPIARYNWQVGEHPEGPPISEVYVFKKTTDYYDRDVKWFSVGTYPRDDEIILGRPGEVHLRFLKAFHQWIRDPKQPCIDLNLNW